MINRWWSVREFRVVFLGNLSDLKTRWSFSFVRSEKVNTHGMVRKQRLTTDHLAVCLAGEAFSSQSILEILAMSLAMISRTITASRTRFI